LTDTTDLLPASTQDTPEQAATTAAPKVRRRATSGGGLTSLVLAELQSLAGDLGITGTGKMRKSQLIEAIQERQNGIAAAKAQVAAEKAAVEAEAPAPSENGHRDHHGSASNGQQHDTGQAEAQDDNQHDDQNDGQDESQNDGELGEDGRPTRVDRGRERFLEREARRQERAAAIARGEDPDAGQPEAREPRQSVEAREPRQPRERTQPRQDAPVAQPAQGQGAGPQDEDEDGNRRGRFRERGRGRNRTTRPGDRFTNDPEPILSDDDVLIPIGGILDILDNYGFVRTTGYLTGPNDVYVTLQQIRKYGLRRGDAVTGAVRQQREGERKDKYNALVRLDSVNGIDDFDEVRKRPEFTKLTPLYPQDRLRLETTPEVLTTRVIDLVMPVGKGQRALIVSPPKAGKTMVMQAIANAITTNNPECHLMVVLVDERPEEVTDMQRSVKGEVIASTFDRPPTDHITVAELSIERAKRLVELGHDVVVLLDSITRLGRAYNLGAPASGRILTGGVDSAALYPPKRFLGAARNIENGGSLTIFATALVETGSAMDTVIFEEFKGTGNAELKLDRRLADKRIFPAIDVDASGTRKEEILLAPQELRIVLQLRRVLHALDTSASLELLLDKMKSTRTNVEFLMQIQKTTVDADDNH
jgi:transcription termination factor Rho